MCEGAIGWEHLSGGLMLGASWARVTLLMLAFQAPAIVHAQTVADALDQPGLVFAGSGAAAWFGQSAVTRDGVDALESGPVGDGQVSAVQAEYTYVNSGRVRFWWRVSSEQDRDAALFLIDGVEVARISGEVGWDQPVFQVSPGLHEFCWEYRKDGSGAGGLDRAWIDTFEVIDLSMFSYVWGLSLDGPSSLDDAAADLDVGPDGHFYVVGTLNAGGLKGWLGRFSADGTRIWTKYFPGKAEGVDTAPDGSIYVTGTASGHMYVKKFTPSGRIIWQKTFEGRGMAVAVSPSGRAIYVTGAVAGDIVVCKLTAGGALRWTRKYNGSARRGDEGRAIVVDPAENLYVAGYARSVGQGRNIWLRKYTAGGTVCWTREVSRDGVGDDWANGVTLDAQGNVYVTGSVTFGGKPIFWSGAYSPQGEKLWGGDLVFPQYLNVRGNDLTLAANGTVNVIGTGVTPEGATQPFLIRLRADSGAVLDEYDLAILTPGIGTGDGIVTIGDGCAFAGSVRYPTEDGGNDILLVRYR